MKVCFNKVVVIMFIYILMFCFATNLHATQNKQGHSNNNNWQRYQNHYWSGNNGWGNKWWKWRGESNYGSGNNWFKSGTWPWQNKGGCNPPPGTNAPEPISSALFALGGVGLGVYRKFRKKD